MTMPFSFAKLFWITKTIAIVACFSVVVLVLDGWWRYSTSRRDLRFFLNGSSDISVVGVKIEGQQQHLELRETASLVYLTEVLRDSKRQEPVFGLTYKVILELSTGSTVECTLYVPDAHFLTLGVVPNAFADYHDYYVVKLREPVPESVTELLHRLRNP